MSKAADFPFCCVRSVGCVLLFFAKWLFGLCFIHVVCVLCVVVEDIFWDCAYIYNNKV